jgi:uncharacterized protein YjbI with pentapeptide repeats
LLSGLLVSIGMVGLWPQWWSQRVADLAGIAKQWWPLMAIAAAVAVLAMPPRRRTGSQKRDPRWLWLLSDQGIGVVILVVGGLGVAATAALLGVASGATTNADLARARMEAIKYGLGTIAAAGVAAALLLAIRRQRHTETDATEQRVTELYTKAVEQLGHSEAAVRLGGLYALERVGQNNPVQRQTIVDVICAYLRMPATLDGRADVETQSNSIATPASLGLPAGSPHDPVNPRDPGQELQVRLAAQRILTRHLRLTNRISDGDALAVPMSPGPSFWPHIDLDLAGAVLHDFDLQSCLVGEARFDGAQFVGGALLVDTRFGSVVVFGRARFQGPALFRGTNFGASALFGGAQFEGLALFDNSHFAGSAEFRDVGFFQQVAFRGAHFVGNVRFNETKFRGISEFGSARFVGDARFDQSTFMHRPNFDDARAAARSGRSDLWPAEWRLVPSSTEPHWLQLETTAVETSHQPQ